jgi:hypothetical protein
MGDDILRRIAQGRGDVGRERDPVLFIAVVSAGGVLVEAACLRGTESAVRAAMTHDGYPDGSYTVIPARLGGF